MSAEGARRLPADPGSISVDRNWLSWLGPHLDELHEAIRRELRREPDDGDLLIVLSSAADSLGARALRASAMDPDVLAIAVKRLRAQANDGDCHRKAEEVRQRKELALETEDRATADRLRQEERRLTIEGRRAQLDALSEIRRRLGLTA
jgi:hypothetical protein